ncbi:MAG: TldD/PmbA family protein [Candidatus Eisenbacteria bacterium]
MDAEKLSKRLLGLIEGSGITEGEVYVQKTRGLEVTLRDQEVERLQNTDAGGFALRLIDDQRMGFVHSSDLREASLERAVEKGVDLARNATPDEFNSLVEPARSAGDVETYDDAIVSVAYDRKINLLKDVETLCFAYDPSISKIGELSYEDSEVETVIANTKGVFQHSASTRFSVGVDVVAERDGEVESGGERSESRFFEDLDPPSRIASKACWKATSLIGGKTLSTQNAPVIFDRDTGYALLGHLFAMINGRNVADGLSLLGGRIGEQIASPLVTVVDDPTISGAIGSRLFDAEGTPSGRTVIVDGGTLRSYLFDSRSGRKAGLATTGNAGRDGFRALPAVGYTNLFVEGGTASPDEIMKTTESGLWLLSLAGWWVGINASTGDFSSGAKGLWIEGGEVAHPVKKVTIASNIIDMLGAVDVIGDDLHLRHAASTPTIRIGEMKIGGV